MTCIIPLVFWKTVLEDSLSLDGTASTSRLGCSKDDEFIASHAREADLPRPVYSKDRED